jgi:hypothetical protein
MAEFRLLSPLGSGASPLRRKWPILAAPLLVASILSGCDGDTLLEPGERGPADGTPGIQVALEVQAPDRMEITDSIRIQITALDPAAVSGMARIGYTAVVHLDGGSSRQAFSAEVAIPQGAPGDTVTAAFTVAPDWLTPSGLPTSFDLEIYGWAFNRSGDCAAAVPEVTGSSFRCRNTEVQGQAYTVGDARATSIPVLAVPGRTSAFPSASLVVGDLQVDTARGNVFLSNRQSNLLHVFRPDTHAWSQNVAVGSEPWGVHMNRTGDTLLVANSGGTSVTHVSLAGSPREVVGQRIQTQNTALFEVGILDEEDEDEDDPDRPTLEGDVRFLDFSDRPQFVAQDAAGRILFSTRPTFSAPLGTVRVLEKRPGWSAHETRILVRVPMDTREAEGTMIVAHVDSIVPYEDGRIEIWDHRPGFPNETIRSGIRRPVEAANFMANQTSSDILFRIDRSWELEAVSFADTTYVAASRDRNWVAFGDGGQPEAGRVVIWHSGTATISNRLTVADLVNNASERIQALELNQNGSLGIARGSFGTYFFSNDLRLRGTVPEEGNGGGGAALHPDHPNTPAPGAASPQTLAFTVSGDRTIRILDTVHYTQRGAIPIRNAITGPMRVTPPLPSDNNGQGRSCSGSDCVVAKLYAVTEAGLSVVDILASHIQEIP